MSYRLPSLRYPQVIRAFRKSGWFIDRQSGSHVTLVKDGREEILTIPLHKGKDIKRGLLHGLIKTAGLSTEDFVNLL